MARRGRKIGSKSLDAKTVQDIIDYAKDNPDKSDAEIAEHLGITTPKVTYHRQKFGIHKRRGRPKGSKFRDVVVDIALSDVRATYKDIAARAGCSIATVSQILGQEKIGRCRLGNSRLDTDEVFRGELKNLVLEGMTLREIGEYFGFTRERARQLIKEYETKFGPIRHLSPVSQATLATDIVKSVLGYLPGSWDQEFIVEGYDDKDKLIKHGKAKAYYVPDDLVGSFWQHIRDKHGIDKLSCLDCGGEKPSTQSRYCASCADERKRLWDKGYKHRDYQEIPRSHKVEGWLLELQKLKEEQAEKPYGDLLTQSEFRRMASLTPIQAYYARHIGLLENAVFEDRQWRGKPQMAFYESDVNLVLRAKKRAKEKESNAVAS